MASYIKFQDFDIKKLRIGECKTNNFHKFKTIELKYDYGNGNKSGLRLRSPSLFTYGVGKYKSNLDYYMSLIPVYDEEEPSEKENKFKETLDSISGFLWEEMSKRERRNEDYFEDLEIIKDNIFFPRLKVKKIYENKKLKDCEIKNIFYGKEEDGSFTPRDPSAYKENKCKVVAYIDIDDIFIGATYKIWTSISDVILVKEDVPSPYKAEKLPTPIEKISLGSDDEQEQKFYLLIYYLILLK